MNDLSLYILDIVQNSVAAKSKRIELVVNENRENNLLTFDIIDNGRGIPSEDIVKVFSPFYTTRTTRNVGLGIPLFKEICELCNGGFEINSIYMEGTTVKARLEYNHINRLPMGSLTETIFSILMNDEDIDIDYTHIINNKKFNFNTKDIKEVLNGISIHQYEIMCWIKDYINAGIKNLEEDL